MGRLLWTAFAGMLLYYPLAAQTAGPVTPPAGVSSPADPANPVDTTASTETTASTDATAAADATTPADDPKNPTNPTNPTSPSTSPLKQPSPDYAPMTFSERARKYILGAFGPGAILRAAAGGGIAQWTETPKEWGVGPDAYGDRFGNAYAKHVIREALEFGGSLALREDNRYFRSTEIGFFKRSKHAAASAFLARNEAGEERFATSRFVSVLGSSFISRLWQPPSEDSSGDAAVSFGLTMVADVGWNFFHEFCPRTLTKRFKVH